MSNFKFKKIDDKFRWESDFMALEFSSPSIQGFQEFVNLTNEEGILYYYYTIRIFKKIVTWDDNDKEVLKWKLVSERSTHDFPCILDLKYILDFQLNDDTIKNGQKIEYRSGDIRYSKIIATEGFGCDDFYEINKSVNNKGKDERYIVYCGTTYDINGDLNSSGIRTPYVDKKDIKALFKCVCDFIQFSLEKHNEQIKLWKGSFEIKHNKIYEYIHGVKVNKDKVESIYAIGDVLNIKTVIDNKETDNDEVKISKIEGKIITLEDGEEIDFDTIVYISNEASEEMLRYNENEIAQDLISILEIEEKEEFKNKTVKKLLDKYKIAIIDRTWMCRDEHKFDIDYKTGDNIKAVTPIVENVINIIKTNL